MTSPTATGIATAAASVREIAPPPPIDLALEQLSDRLGALEVTFSVLNARLGPVMRDDSYDPAPTITLDTAFVGGEDTVETRGDVLRRLEALARGIAAVTRDLDRAITRLEV